MGRLGVFWWGLFIDFGLIKENNWKIVANNIYGEKFSLNIEELSTKSASISLLKKLTFIIKSKSDPQKSRIIVN